MTIIPLTLSRRTLDDSMLIGMALAAAYTVWLFIERYAKHVTIEDCRFITNTTERYFEDPIKISSIVYIARLPHFVFRSWGARMVIYFHDDTKVLRQTYLPETMYRQVDLHEILSHLIAINPLIELAPHYIQKTFGKKNYSTT